jgi:hypothetical protein
MLRVLLEPRVSNMLLEVSHLYRLGNSKLTMSSGIRDFVDITTAGSQQVR